MIKDESVRETAPEQCNPAGDSVFGRVLRTLLFTAAQVWAGGVLAGAGLAGAASFALALVLSAAFLATFDAWREMFLHVVERRMPRHSGGIRDSAVEE
ncbi:hypothetical protein [Saccharopolyspora thermophila]|uniref:hypothetical protein n=1 Tax=Saccharopolyspora thermophila TaxID=89367 RepID=UPI00166F175F|nr:hypothetical protein [Saccharopolyspora subtropica]